jgi:hypothetical protein
MFRQNPANTISVQKCSHHHYSIDSIALNTRYIKAVYCVVGTKSYATPGPGGAIFSSATALALALALPPALPPELFACESGGVI